MTRSNRLALIAVAPLVLLAACGDDAEVSTEDDGREASGEVLEGSISDAMLPIDQVRSQAPQREPDPAESGNDGTSVATEAPADAETAEAVEPAEEPAAE